MTILSGLVSGNFSGFWIGLVIVALMAGAYFASTFIPVDMMIYASVFAFGLVAFGFLGMGPVTIAVDSYGPVTDNAQSVYELSLIENIPNISEEIDKFFFQIRPEILRTEQCTAFNFGDRRTNLRKRPRIHRRADRIRLREQALLLRFQVVIFGKLVEFQLLDDLSQRLFGFRFLCF